MAPTAEQTKRGYANLWDSMSITKPLEAERVASRILVNKTRYQQIERDTGVPWIMAAVIHMRESDLDFKTHMHNGDSLRDYTHHVPAGRPKVGHGPPFTFEESTDDAFTMPGIAFDKLRGKWNLELMLFSEEGNNGWGYAVNDYGNSPYDWSWTSHYSIGKYGEDGHYDRDLVDKQPGCAAIMKTLGDMDADAKRWITTRADGRTPIPKEAMKQHTRKERTAAQAGGVGTVTGTGTVASNPKDTGSKVFTTFAGGTIAVLGVVVLVVAAVLLYRKTEALKQRFFGIQ